MKKIVILGAGITGLTLAERLSKKFKGQVILIEKEEFLGGLAATLARDGLSFDLGSHRIHSDFSPTALRYFKNTLRLELLKRARKGKFYLEGRFLDYPPNILNLLTTISFKDNIGFFTSYLKKFFKPSKKEKNYEDVLTGLVGQKAYNAFFKDFANKLWGKDPRDISIDGVKKRITILNFKSIWRTISGKTKYFFYPKYGIGEIANSLENLALANGVKILKKTKVKKILHQNKKIQAITIEGPDGKEENIDVDILISTIPIDAIHKMIFGEKYLNPGLAWRAVRILYAHIDKQLKIKSETIYFPGMDVKIGRVSNIKKYSCCLNSDITGTLLTIETPLYPEDREWAMDDKEFLQLALNDLIKVKVLDRYPAVKRYFSLKLEKTYPIYELKWKEKFFKIYSELDENENLFVLGRNGLFLHCNIDHCILQALELSGFILNGSRHDKDVWGNRVKRFLNFYARD